MKQLEWNYNFSEAPVEKWVLLALCDKRLTQQSLYDTRLKRWIGVSDQSKLLAWMIIPHPTLTEPVKLPSGVITP